LNGLKNLCGLNSVVKSFQSNFFWEKQSEHFFVMELS
jgi:hypothetical protein